MKSIFGILFLILVIHTANAQFFQTGQDPSQIKWKQINTDHFQVIYPREFDKEAQRLSFVLSKVYEYGSQTLKFNPRKISVILHTRTVNANGLVAWAPKRIELFTTPHQQIYAQDWLEELAVHEFRHLVQLDKIQSELPVILKLLFGEQAASMVIGAYLPLWFLEGDAVVTETALSNSGRGRLASFGMEYRAQLTKRGKYSFDKAYLGSYKDFVPDHYKLGYWLVGKTREEFGAQTWSDVLDKVGNRPFSITPMNSVLKKETGMNIKQLYNHVFDDLTNRWKQDLKIEKKDFSVVSPTRKNYTNYLYPEFYKDSLIVAYRTSIDDIGRFVMISPHKSESIVYTPGTILEESVSINNQYIIWAERRADIRWTHGERSVIMVYNLETKKKSEISNQNKLFSPVISPDLKSFAAIEVNPENQCFLAILDLESGKELQRFTTNDNQYFFTPCWDEKGEKLYFVSLSSKGKCMTSLDLQTKEFKSISDFTFGNLKNPVYTHQQLIFAGDFSGTDHLYTLDLEKFKIFKIYDAPFGSDYPSQVNSKNEILLSDYSSNGYHISKIKLSQSNQLNEVTDIQQNKNQLAEHLATQEKGIPDLTNKDSIKYSSRSYSKWGHLFNFHSWSPAFIDINNYDIRPGAAIYSQNVLGTAETLIGYDYDVSERTGKYKVGFKYSGLFPQFSTTLSFGKRKAQYNEITTTTNRFNQVIKSDTVVKRFDWNEWTADFDVSLPLNLSKGKYSTALFPEVKYTFNQVVPNSTAPDNFYSGYYHAMTYRLYYYHLLHQSAQNIHPRWGQQVDFIYRHTPFLGKDFGTLAGVQTILFFPGFLNNDGFKIYQGYQQKRYAGSSGFSNFIRFPRGIFSFDNNQMYSFAGDYYMPIAYPDVNFGKLIYLKRIKSSIFYDHAYFSVPVVKNKVLIPNYHQFDMNSFGLELTSDLHILRFFAPLEIGGRSIYLPESNTFRFELLMSIDFNGF